VLASSDVSSSRFAEIDAPGWAWAALVGVIAVLLLVDLLVVHRRPHAVTFRQAAIESAVWIGLGLGVTAVFASTVGGAAAGEYLSGYLIEKTLSVDNVFVWAVVFGYFAVPAEHQFRVLFWGVFGALVLRAAFIFAGVALLETFEPILYVFGALLLFTAAKIVRHSGAEVDPARNPVLRIARRLVPSTGDYDGQKLFTRRNGRRVATPLLIVLVVIETTDVVFAVDSIPAILAVSREPFVVFASNAFAVLGLRSLYFCLAGMAQRLRYLNRGLGVILAFVGVKMLLADLVHPPAFAGSTVIAGVLAVTIVTSLRGDGRRAGAGDDDGSPRTTASLRCVPHGSGGGR